MLQTIDTYIVVNLVALFNRFASLCYEVTKSTRLQFTLVTNGTKGGEKRRCAFYACSGTGTPRQNCSHDQIQRNPSKLQRSGGNGDAVGTNNLCFYEGYFHAGIKTPRFAQFRTGPLFSVHVTRGGP